MPSRAAQHTMCPDDSATAAWQLGRCRAGQLRYGFVAVLVGQIVIQNRKL
jgi:hypothetical protein